MAYLHRRMVRLHTHSLITYLHTIAHPNDGDAPAKTNQF